MTLASLDGPQLPEPGLMMDVQLTVPLVIERMSTVHGASTVSTARSAGVNPNVTTVTFRQVIERSERFARVLANLGVKPGDRVGSLAWNTQEHLEIYYAVTGSGAVLHTINLRLHPDQLVYTINHARDTVIVVDAALYDQFAAIRDRLVTVKTVIVIGGAKPGDHDFEDLLAAVEPGFEWPSLDERAAACLCYTSGTTGNPKGVLYSQRSIVLHALVMGGTDVFRVAGQDVVLALVPLFHVMGWGLPFVCGLTGADIVLPGPHLDPETIGALIAARRVTWSGGVPTLWMDLLNELERRRQSGSVVDITSLKTVLCGGTAVPEVMMRRYDELGVQVVQGWGMTEVFPGAAVVPPSAFTSDADWKQRSAAGRLSPLYQMRTVGDDGRALPHDGRSVGELQVRGPLVAKQYLGQDEATDSFVDGWLRTGDMGTIDEEGFIRITDRLKDAIKSGGEWISSLDLESLLMEHSAVLEAAVVGRPDDRWSERPVAFIVADRPLDADDLRNFLTPLVEKWCVPDDFLFVDHLPRTSTGKFDKKMLRQTLAPAGSPT